MSDNNSEASEKTTTTVLAGNPTEGVVLKRKPKKYLDARWLCETAKLAQKYNTKIIFDKDGRVFGIPSDCGGSSAIFYPINKEWCDYVLSLFPEGAIFSGGDLFSDRESNLTMKTYANLVLPEDGGKCWVDEIKGVVHVETDRVKIKSGVLCACDFTLELHVPDVIDDLDFSELFEKKEIEILLACVSKNESSPSASQMTRINHTVIDNKTALYATNRHSLVCRFCDKIQEGFTLNPNFVDIFRVRGYTQISEQKNEKEVDRRIQTFKMDDGCVIVEVTPATQNINVGFIVTGAKNNTPDCIVKRESLSEVFSDCSRLGLFSTNMPVAVWIKNGKCSVMHSGAEVASFDIECDAPEDDVYVFKPALLEPAIKIGADLTFSKNKPMVVSNDKIVFVAMPLRIEE